IQQHLFVPVEEVHVHVVAHPVVLDPEHGAVQRLPLPQGSEHTAVAGGFLGHGNSVPHRSGRELPTKGGVHPHSSGSLRRGPAQCDLPNTLTRRSGSRGHGGPARGIGPAPSRWCVGRWCVGRWCWLRPTSTPVSGLSSTPASRPTSTVESRPTSTPVSRPGAEPESAPGVSVRSRCQFGRSSSACCQKASSSREAVRNTVTSSSKRCSVRERAPRRSRRSVARRAACWKPSPAYSAIQSR